MDAKSKQASGGIEFAVISPLVLLGLDSKPRIPVGKNFRILAWIDRDRADIQNFRRRRLGKRRHREKNKRDHEIDFSNSRSRDHPHKFHFNSSSLLVSELKAAFFSSALVGDNIPVPRRDLCKSCSF